MGWRSWGGEKGACYSSFILTKVLLQKEREYEKSFF
jgi:hypothetical protein